MIKDLAGYRATPARSALMVSEKVHNMIQTVQFRRGAPRQHIRDLVERALIDYYADELAEQEAEQCTD